MNIPRLRGRRPRCRERGRLQIRRIDPKYCRHHYRKLGRDGRPRIRGDLPEGRRLGGVCEIDAPLMLVYRQFLIETLAKFLEPRRTDCTTRCN